MKETVDVFSGDWRLFLQLTVSLLGWMILLDSVVVDLQSCL